MGQTISSKEYKKIVTKIIEARKDSGITQVQLAKILKRHQSYVSRLESGEYRIDVLELKTLAKIYNKSFSWFLE
jgi:transcriptional regulator with XRE-family HTH domain